MTPQLRHEISSQDPSLKPEVIQPLEAIFSQSNIWTIFLDSFMCSTACGTAHIRLHFREVEMLKFIVFM